ncbi:alpha/beta hydrolase [Microbulbifer variabilis]|uniref:alpha/beta hydrolase n=1 Tax=Microbulbifer variabilis TaxID=266805 RepID=UPI001CFEDB6A|nr:alpha/beta hydrolase-fold protein [Microbulbifer variabilis]
MSLRIFILCFLLATSRLLIASPLLPGERLTIESKILSENRELQVLLPEKYLENPDFSYPVIYLLDGDYNFRSVSGILEFLGNKGEMIPDVILVGIADRGTASYRHYMTPSELPSISMEGQNGNADDFRSFIEKEVKPLIHKRYRASTNSILVGQSVGGLFVLDYYLEAPNAFDHYIAISPAVWYSENGIIKKAKEKLKNDRMNSRLSLSVADEMQMGQYGFIHQLDMLPPGSADWSFRHYPEESHNSIGPISLRNSLKEIFAGWYLPENSSSSLQDPESLVKYYQSKMEEFSLRQSIPSASVKAAIRFFYRQEQTDKIDEFMDKIRDQLPQSEKAFLLMWVDYTAHFDTAENGIKLLKKYEGKYRHSLDFNKTLADLYEKHGNKSMARKYYQEARSIAQSQDAEQWQINILESKLL